jgi:Adenylate and Guanylate cyclase catalytic domain
MESNSVANRIQCSEKSALILKEQDPDILVLKRGKVAIKGKGEMITYWIGDSALSSGDKDPSSSGVDRAGKCVSFGSPNDATCSIDSTKRFGSGVLKKTKNTSFV